MERRGKSLRFRKFPDVCGWGLKTLRLVTATDSYGMRRIVFFCFISWKKGASFSDCNEKVSYGLLYHFICNTKPAGCLRVALILTYPYDVCSELAYAKLMQRSNHFTLREYRGSFGKPYFRNKQNCSVWKNEPQ